MASKKRKKSKPERLKPLPLYPLKAEEALRILIQVKPEDMRIKTRGQQYKSCFANYIIPIG